MIVNTPFYSTKAQEILDAVHGQLSDGMWENSPRMDKYWRNFRVKKDEYGRIYFDVTTSWDSPFSYMNDADFLEWYAHKLKAVIKQEGKDNSWMKGWWNRANTTNTSVYLNYHETITVADIYCVYDTLLGRKTRVDCAIASEILGKPLSKEVVARNRKIVALKKQQFEEVAALNVEEDTKAKELKKEYETKRSDVMEKYSKLLAELEAA